MFVDIIKVPQTTINKAINDYHKRLNKTRVLADGGHFEHIM